MIENNQTLQTMHELFQEIANNFQQPFKIGKMITSNHEAIADLLETSELNIQNTIVKFWQSETNLRETDTGRIDQYLDEVDMVRLATRILDRTDSPVSPEHVAYFLEDVNLFTA